MPEAHVRTLLTLLPLLIITVLATPPLSAQPKAAGVPCTSNSECASQRCDLRARGSAQRCIPRDGWGQQGEYCSHGNQCGGGLHCRMVPGEPQRCSFPVLSGSLCLVNTDCRSGRCDMAAGNQRRCIPNDGTGGFNEYCSHPNHCGGNLHCQLLPGSATVCRRPEALAAQCLGNDYCRSGRCDMPDQLGNDLLTATAVVTAAWGAPAVAAGLAGAAAGNSGDGHTYRCIPNDGEGRNDDFCSHDNQCLKGYHCRALPDSYEALRQGQLQRPACSPRVDVGQPCLRGGDCQSGRCATRGGPRLCVARSGEGATGAFCTAHRQCRSGDCRPASPGALATCQAPPPRRPRSPTLPRPAD